MPLRTLTLRELNRATLERQMLLQRQSLPVVEAVERVLGLQSQIPNPPYIGLWTRLSSFQRDDLTQLMEERRIIRAAMMRSTLHLMTGADHQRFRPVIQPALTRALAAFFGKKAQGVDIEKLVETARDFLAEEARSTGALRERLLEIEPERNGDALAYAVRTHLPLVQVPPGGTWGSGSMASYRVAESWLDDATQAADLRSLFFRYLAAFGPASVMDFQTWSGMTRLQSELEPHLGELVTYADENGKTLFDLPNQPLPPADSPAPVRFIPEYDNLLIAHADRSRVIADADRPRVFLSAARVQSTILVDGFVRGTWKATSKKKQAELVIEPFVDLDSAARAALQAEGERLLRFIYDDAEVFDIRGL